jgi:hypothetical protein
MTIARLEPLGGPVGDGLSYTHLFREKNYGKHVAKYQSYQTIMPEILMHTMNDFLKMF